MPLSVLRTDSRSEMAELLLVYIGDDQVPVSLREAGASRFEKQYTTGC